MAMALLLTTDEEAILSKLLRVRRSVGNAKRVSQRCVGQPKQLRSEDQFTQENASAPRCDHSIRAMEGGITHGSRPRTDTRDRGDLLANVFAWTINIVMTLAMMSLVLREHREHVEHGDYHGCNFLALVAMQARFYPVPRQPPPLSKSNPGSNSKVSKHSDLNATIQTEKCLFHVGHRRK